MTLTKARQAERETALDYLRDMVTVGSTVYTTCSHVSSSGMSRHIGVVVVVTREDGQPYARNVSHLVAKAIGARLNKRGDALVIGGAGMDMGFHTVYSLSRSLWPDGHPCTGERGCPSNDHTNEWQAPSFDPSRVHRDGGYALNQSWL